MDNWSSIYSISPAICFVPTAFLASSRAIGLKGWLRYPKGYYYDLNYNQVIDNCVTFYKARYKNEITLVEEEELKAKARKLAKERKIKIKKEQDIALKKKIQDEINSKLNSDNVVVSSINNIQNSVYRNSFLDYLMSASASYYEKLASINNSKFNQPKRGEFESSIQYSDRIEREELNFKQSKLNKVNEFKLNRIQFIGNNLNGAIGKLEIGSLTYMPDDQYFKIEVKAQSGNKLFEAQIAASNAIAPSFKPLILKSEIYVGLTLDGDFALQKSDIIFAYIDKINPKNSKVFDGKTKLNLFNISQDNVQEWLLEQEKIAKDKERERKERERKIEQERRREAKRAEIEMFKNVQEFSNTVLMNIRKTPTCQLFADDIRHIVNSRNSASNKFLKIEQLSRIMARANCYN